MNSIPTRHSARLRGRKQSGCLFAATCGEKTLASHERSITDPSRDCAERYLSWLSLLPLRLNPVGFTGRRSRAD